MGSSLVSSLAAMNFQGYCFAEIPGSADPVRVLRYFEACFGRIKISDRTFEWLHRLGSFIRSV